MNRSILRRSARALLLPALALLVAACAGGRSGPPPGGGAPGGGAEADGGPDGPRQLSAADSAALRVAGIRVDPDTVRVRVGETATVQVAAVDSAGEEVSGAPVRHMMRGGAATFDAATGTVSTREPGEATLMVGLRKPPAEPGGEPSTLVERVTVVVEPLPVAEVTVEPPDGPLYAGTRKRLVAEARSEERVREDAAFGWSSSDTAVATVNARGLVRAGAPGTATITAAAEGVEGTARVEVVANPVRRVEIEAPPGDSVRVGDPVGLGARALDGDGEPVSDAPVTWTVEGPHGGMSEEAYLDAEGRFVAEEPGLYFVTATSGERSATVELAAAPRPPRRSMEVVGHGGVPGHTTSDLWVFQGVDGKDYAYTGTHAAGAGGNVMYAWDVSDPSDPVITDSVVVDARVVNDVKINETRELAVITREGASDRKNGIVILDIRVPAHPKVLAHHTDKLTAGVHNTWIEGDLVYAVHNGTRALHIIDISDPREPEQVGRWQLEAEDRYLHDVTVKDGLAYLSYWDHGLVILDVGRGVAGGTATDPEQVSQIVYRGTFGPETYGNTHHAIRHGDYVFVGDEIFGCAECVNGPRGYVHVIDVSDLEDPEEVAWYRVPEAGTHNLWAEDDRLYVAHYQGGLRVVDVSGELRGDLYDQGREVGWLMTESSIAPGSPGPDEVEAFRPHATMTWGPQVHEGLIYLSDMNSGLWIVDFAGEERDGDDGGAAGDAAGESAADPSGGSGDPGGAPDGGPGGRR